MIAAPEKPGTAVVIRETGEEKVIGAPFDMATFLSDLASPAHAAQQKKLAGLYDTACVALLGPNDMQSDKGRMFKKKSAWRKLARYFNISTRVVNVIREHLPSGHFIATVTVEASAPWGQSAEALGSCSTDEATGRRVITIADAIATAETRATNRATSNLIAMGEVSAEEMTGKSAPPAARTPKSAGEKLMPFGKHKGVALRDLPADVLESTIAWCREKDAQKFADLIAACDAVLVDKAEDEQAGVVADGFPQSLQDEDDDLPF